MKPDLIKVVLKERIKRTLTVESFRFMPDEKIEFVPGQFLQLIFDEKDYSNKELNKYLSFSSSPFSDYIEVTKRLSGSIFSHELRNLKVNDEIMIKAPLGNCIFKDRYKKIGFLIGGIGITPVISILEYIIDKNIDTEAILFYSNRIEEEIAFKKELIGFHKDHSCIKVVYIVTEREPKDVSCVFGRIDKDLIMEKDKQFDGRAVFIFGPPRMVEAMKSICQKVGTPDDSIKTESFLGY